MEAALFVCFIVGLAAVSSATECKQLNHRQDIFMYSKGINVPSDYCYISGTGIYKLHEDLSSWNDARKTCNDEGGHLAIIKSKEEADSLAKMFRDSDLMYEGDKPSKGVFVGFHDMYHEGEFVTIFGQPLEETGYSTFSKEWGGQPDNGMVFGQGTGSQNCGALAYDGGLDDVQCGWSLGFICQIPMTTKYSF